MAAPVDPTPNFVPHTAAVADQVDARFAPLYTGLDRSKPSGGLDAASIKDGIVVPGLTVVDPWQTLALAGMTWSPTTLEFYKDLMSIVRFRSKGYTVSGTLANGQVLATLPAGYRPGVTSYIRLATNAITASGILYGRCSIDTAGVITYEATTSTLGPLVAFHGSFKAEN